MIPSALLLLALQAPQPPGPDLIRLDNGSEIEGTIQRETDDYIEIEIGEDTVVGFEKSRAVAIIRSAAAPAVARGAVPAVEEGPREQWFALHDGRGAAVGWLQETIGRDREGRARFGEEWRFTRGETATEITVLETLDAGGRPATCFYRERVLDRSDRLVAERVVRGVVDGDLFEVDQQSLAGATRRTYEFPSGARFPLELRHDLRRRSQPGELEFRVYDPRAEEWIREAFEVGGGRSIVRDGGRIHVRVVRESTTRGANVEWLDGTCTPVRREIAGPALVAVPMTESRARARGEASSPSFEPALAVEAGSRFALWLPNPLWSVAAERHGEITAAADAFGATMSLVLLDQLGSEVLLDTAVDTVERWLRLAHSDIRFEARVRFRLRDTDAVRMRGTYEQKSPGRAVQHTCDVVVFEPAGLGVLSFCADAPSAAFAELEPDFASTLRSIEPYREGFSPRLRGPLGVR